MTSSDLRAQLGFRAGELLASTADSLGASLSDLSQAIETPAEDRSGVQRSWIAALTTIADTKMRRHKYTTTIVDDFYVRARQGQPGEAAFIGGLEALRLHGYSAADIEGLPTAAASRFLGIGNLWHDVTIGERSRVLDVGCGSGVDLGVASRRVGGAGVLVGIDKRPDLLETAALTCPFATLLVGDVGALPEFDIAFDLVLANGLPPLQRPTSINDTAAILCALTCEGGTVSATVIVTAASIVIDLAAMYPNRSDGFARSMATLITGKPNLEDAVDAFERAGAAASYHLGENPYLDPLDRELTSVINVVAISGRRSSGESGRI